jgi:hypothetical protein
VVDLVPGRAVLAGCGLVTLVYALAWWFATRRRRPVDAA